DALAARDRLPFVRRTDGLTVLHGGGELPYVIDTAAESADRRAQLLDADGVDRAVVALSSPIGIEALPHDVASELISAHLDGVLALDARFDAWGPVPVDHPDPADVDDVLRRGCAGVSVPAQPRRSTSSTSAGSGWSTGTGPQASKRASSASTPSRWAEMSSLATSWGSASIPIGLDSATTARSTPSASSSCARRSADSAAVSITYGSSPPPCRTVRPSVRRTKGRRSRRASASSRGGVQTCWCRSTVMTPMKITNSISFIKIEMNDRGRRGGGVARTAAGWGEEERGRGEKERGRGEPRCGPPGSAGGGV